ncbi:MAG: tyrosine--tRNA ligase [Promicromonosporaceae bacterium]|nr:tyrosine--tRNA ligase [Promicromonosporaceae bacterium]
MTHVLDDLIWRGLVAQTTDVDALRAALDAGPVTYYVGFDPTASSLHVGHMVQLLNMRRLQQAGHRPLALVGGATGLIGDPRPTTERSMNSPEVVAGWVESIRAQIEPFLSFEGENAARMVNNLDWTAPLSAIDFLRDVGKHFRMGTMLSKDIVARRLGSEEGLSFTEFSYQILQGMDYRELFDNYGCTLQMGGNDQWGNLLSGVELIRKTRQQPVHALAATLITKSDGSKMGKSEGGAVWLDPGLTSPYAFYQFWLNTADEDVVHYLKVFTFRTQEEIEALAQSVAERPYAREAQRALAGDITTLVHGAAATEAAIFAASALFGRGDVRELDAQTLRSVAEELQTATTPAGTSVLDALVNVKLVDSKSEARRAIKDGGVYLNNVKVLAEDATITAADLLHGNYALLRRGKKALAMGVGNAA